MDLNARYGEIVKTIVNEYAAFKPSYGDVAVETVFDVAAGGYYELVYAGWNGHRRIHGSVLHVDVCEGTLDSTRWHRRRDRGAAGRGGDPTRSHRAGVPSS